MISREVPAALSALGIFLAVPAPAMSPQDATLPDRLAGVTSRDWVKQREVVFMGDGRCSSGERWRFVAGGRLRVRRCVDGRFTVSEYRWRADVQGGKSVLRTDPALPESGRRVLLSDDGRRLFLRRIPGTKTEGIDSVEFGLWTGANLDF